jgi:hypothetical protein
VIREERDAAFWTSVFEDPAVKPHVALGHQLDLAEVVGSAAVMPLASENGGFIFARLDGLGRVWELHTLFRPRAWGGREVVVSAIEAFTLMFATSADVIVTHEVEGWRRSRPPLSFRFAPAGPFGPAPAIGPALRTWTLTRNAWDDSPARRRM